MAGIRNQHEVSEAVVTDKHTRNYCIAEIDDLIAGVNDCIAGIDDGGAGIDDCIAEIDAMQ